MYTRRNFIQTAAAGLALSGLDVNMLSAAPAVNRDTDFIWAYLLMIGRNKVIDNPFGYYDRVPAEQRITWRAQTDYLRCEDKAWETITQKMADVGMNMIVIGMNEGVEFKSHPELKVRDTWSQDRFRKELDRLRKLGLEPIPKLNFSTCHDTWLKDYQRMISTPTYYRVCSDLVQETCELFDTPRFLHLGYDEETYNHQKAYEYVVIRQGELWWHDFLFFVKEVEKCNVRPWIWSDYIWHHKDEFLQRMPKSVLQSNWYYDMGFDPNKSVYVQSFLELEKAGFDQVPTGSTWAKEENFPKLVEYCREHIAPERLKGFCQTAWTTTADVYLDKNIKALEIAGAMKKP